MEGYGEEGAMKKSKVTGSVMRKLRGRNVSMEAVKQGLRKKFTNYNQSLCNIGME